MCYRKFLDAIDVLLYEADRLIAEDKQLPVDLVAKLTEAGVYLSTLSGEQDHG